MTRFCLPARPWKQVGLWLSLFATVILALVIALRCLFNHLPLFGQYHDDALYVVTAKALAEGSGYRIISLPSAVCATKYPVIYPWVLSLIWRIKPQFPANLLALEALGVALGFIFGLSAGLYLLGTKRVTGWIATVLVGATLLNIKFLSFLPMPMSDLLYAVLTVSCLWLAERIGRRGPDRFGPAAVWLALLEVLTALTRAAGLGLVLTCGSYLAIRGKYRALALSVVVFLGVMSPYWWWNQSNQPPGPPWLLYYTSYAQWSLNTYRDSGAATIAINRASEAFSAVLQVVWPLITHVPYLALSPFQYFLIYRLGYLCLWLVLIAGIYRDLISPRRCQLALYLLIYGLAMLIWPGFLQWRLVLVVLPFLYYFYYRGFRLLSGRVKQLFRPRYKAYSWLTAAISLCFGLYLIFGSAWSSVLKAGSYPRRMPLREDISARDENLDSLATYAWIRDNTTDRDIFVCNNDPLLYLATGRRAVQACGYEGWRFLGLQFVTPDSLSVLLRQSGASYLLLDPSFGGAYLVYAELFHSAAMLSASKPGLLTPVYASPHRLETVFKVDRAFID